MPAGWSVRRPNRGSRLANVLLVVVLLLIGGVGYYVFAETRGWSSTVAAEDPLPRPRPTPWR